MIDRREDVKKQIVKALEAGDMATGKTPQSSYNPAPSPFTGAVEGISNAPDGIAANIPMLMGNSEEAFRNWIIDKESSGRTTAQNPTSSAFGLGQLIKVNREAYAKRFGFSPDTTDYDEQLKMMDAYVDDRYGSYARAKEFWENNNWY
jgi:hypothetical protein